MIGLLCCECFVYNAQSLKEKRAVLQRIIDRLKQQFNVSVAETDFQDVWQRTELSIVTVASNRKMAEKELNRALNLIDSFPEIEATITTTEWF